MGCPFDCLAANIASSPKVENCASPHPNAVCNNLTARWEIPGPIALDSFTGNIMCPTHVLGDITAPTVYTFNRTHFCGTLTASGTIFLGSNMTVTSTNISKNDGQTWKQLESPTVCEFTSVSFSNPVPNCTLCPVYNNVDGTLAVQVRCGRACDVSATRSCTLIVPPPGTVPPPAVAPAVVPAVTPVVAPAPRAQGSASSVSVAFSFLVAVIVYTAALLN